MSRDDKRKNNKHKKSNSKKESKQSSASEKVAKQEEQAEISEKIALFDKLPTECLACLKEFDKTNKTQVRTWSVVVRNDIGEVRLYCPDCWQKAKDVVQAYEKEHGYD